MSCFQCFFSLLLRCHFSSFLSCVLVFCRQNQICMYISLLSALCGIFVHYYVAVSQPFTFYGRFQFYCCRCRRNVCIQYVGWFNRDIQLFHLYAVCHLFFVWSLLFSRCTNDKRIMFRKIYSPTNLKRDAPTKTQNDVIIVGATL